ncbi:MAG: L-serine ammonia-lyase [Flavobacteriaceae bacterium]
MFLSVFDIFKIGIGPSSSHTVGPMVAAARFLRKIAERRPEGAESLTVSLHGSLAFTGKGHGSDRAIFLGLMGEKPDKVDPDRVEDIIAALRAAKSVEIESFGALSFDPDSSLTFDYGPPLPGHANGMQFLVLDAEGNQVLEETYYSVGGGFIRTDGELRNLSDDESPLARDHGPVPHPFASAGEMLRMGEESGLSIVAMKRANETARMPSDELDRRLDALWGAMESCMNRGLSAEGCLPGGLKVKRRAGEIYRKLLSEHGYNTIQPHKVMDWLSVFAMAVNEENAAGGKVVTSPTNGAAGVIPAVMRYYLDHCIGANRDGIRTFLLVASAIGGIIKHNASISGAEVGCQGEVGSASAMAAAGLCAALGGTNAQIENAAEIALEHHLGMTCDPVGGLVQVPCIERNALGAVKAVTAASLALRGDGSHFVPLDTCIETMRQTGHDMMEKYKETSQGGLAVNVVEC